MAYPRAYEKLLYELDRHKQENGPELKRVGNDMDRISKDIAHTYRLCKKDVKKMLIEVQSGKVRR